MAPVLDERGRRLWAATESVAIGYGGDALVSAATGLARQTIANGRRELADGVVATTRIRRAGAGRPGIAATQPGLAAALEALVEPLTRGDPTSPLRWTCKSRARLTAALVADGWQVSSTTVGRLLHALGYVHDFPGDAVRKAIPYGVYDMARNEAWVNVGRDHDTPASLSRRSVSGGR